LDGAFTELKKQFGLLAARTAKNRVPAASVPSAMLRVRHRRRFLVKDRRGLAPQGFRRAPLHGLKRPRDPRPNRTIDLIIRQINQILSALAALR
jgi:hypothetical protein